MKERSPVDMFIEVRIAARRGAKEELVPCNSCHLSPNSCGKILFDSQFGAVCDLRQPPIHLDGVNTNNKPVTMEEV